MRYKTLTYYIIEIRDVEISDWGRNDFFIIIGLSEKLVSILKENLNLIHR